MMKEMIIFAGVMAALISSGCEKEQKLESTLFLNDTVEMANFETKYNHENNIVLRMDSVLGDSRCPSNVQCVWEGNAEVRFLFTVDSKGTDFVLNTHGGKQFNSDTVISGYRIILMDLSPYPEDPGEILQVEYYSQVIVKAATAIQ